MVRLSKNEASMPTVGFFYSEGNACFRKGLYKKAIALYGKGMACAPELVDNFSLNFLYAKRRFFQEKKRSRLKVGVIGWELSHNAAGRVYTLAQLYSKFSCVEILGCIDSSRGTSIWEPISNLNFATHTILIDNWADFVKEAFILVSQHPYDVVHLSKPRAPNIIFGVLYKIFWNAKVFVDIDDEELGFFNDDSRDFDLDSTALLSLSDLDGFEWTRVAVSLSREFDAITISNVALQKKYSGTVIPHAREESKYQPSRKLRELSRGKFGISIEDKVVLFMGTPRKHKGLLEVAENIAKLERSDVVFMIVGDFQDGNLKKKLLGIVGVKYLFFENQPIEDVPSVIAVADVVVLLQEKKSLVAQFQMPAKLSDALAMKVPVLVNDGMPPFADLISFGAVYPVNMVNICDVLGCIFDNSAFSESLSLRGYEYFLHHLSFAKCYSDLEEMVTKSDNMSLSPELFFLANGIGVGDLL